MQQSNIDEVLRQEAYLLFYVAKAASAATHHPPSTAPSQLSPSSTLRHVNAAAPKHEESATVGSFAGPLINREDVGVAVTDPLVIVKLAEKQKALAAKLAKQKVELPACATAASANDRDADEAVLVAAALSSSRLKRGLCGRSGRH